jgi:hypothetical protein
MSDTNPVGLIAKSLGAGFSLGLTQATAGFVRDAAVKAKKEYEKRWGAPEKEEATNSEIDETLAKLGDDDDA